MSTGNDMARSIRMASRPEILADEVRDDTRPAIRGLVNGLLMMALILTALVASCVEFAL